MTGRHEDRLFSGRLIGGAAILRRGWRGGVAVLLFLQERVFFVRFAHRAFVETFENIFRNRFARVDEDIPRPPERRVVLRNRFGEPELLEARFFVDDDVAFHEFGDRVFPRIRRRFLLVVLHKGLREIKGGTSSRSPTTQENRIGARRLHRENRERNFLPVPPVFEGVFRIRAQRGHDDKSRRAPRTRDPVGDGVTPRRLGTEDNRAPVPRFGGDFFEDDESLESGRDDGSWNRGGGLSACDFGLRNGVSESLDSLFDDFGILTRISGAADDGRVDEGVASDRVGEREGDGGGVANREVRRGDHWDLRVDELLEGGAFSGVAAHALTRRGGFFLRRGVVRRVVDGERFFVGDRFGFRFRLRVGDGIWSRVALPFFREGFVVWFEGVKLLFGRVIGGVEIVVLRLVRGLELFGSHSFFGLGVGRVGVVWGRIGVLRRVGVGERRVVDARGFVVRFDGRGLREAERFEGEIPERVVRNNDEF